MMRFRAFRYSRILLLLVAFFSIELSVGTGQPLEKHGRLIVHVTWGDSDNTPATDVLVEAQGYIFGRKSSSETIIPMNASHEGQYETSLPPGLYDVFVSEPTSVPRCRRVLIKAGEPKYWDLKLEIDDVYLEK